MGTEAPSVTDVIERFEKMLIGWQQMVEFKPEVANHGIAECTIVLAALKAYHPDAEPVAWIVRPAPRNGVPQHFIRCLTIHKGDYAQFDRVRPRPVKSPGQAGIAHIGLLVALCCFVMFVMQQPNWNAPASPGNPIAEVRSSLDLKNVYVLNCPVNIEAMGGVATTQYENQLLHREDMLSEGIHGAVLSGPQYGNSCMRLELERKIVRSFREWERQNFALDYGFNIMGRRLTGILNVWPNLKVSCVSLALLNDFSGVNTNICPQLPFTGFFGIASNSPRLYPQQDGGKHQCSRKNSKELVGPFNRFLLSFGLLALAFPLIFYGCANMKVGGDTYGRALIWFGGFCCFAGPLSLLGDWWNILWGWLAGA